jgi:CBS domain-containing protein
MTHPAITVRVDDFVAKAAAIMVDRKIGALPVIGEDSQLVGILSETDVLRFFAEEQAEAYRAAI